MVGMRHGAGESGHAPRRPHHRRRHALRRPCCRTLEGFRARGAHRPRRSRSEGVRSSRARRRARAGRCARGARRLAGVVTRASVQHGGRGCASWTGEHNGCGVVDSSTAPQDEAPTTPEVVRALAPRGGRRRDGRPRTSASTRCSWRCITASIDRASSDEWRAGHDGLRAARGDGREDRHARPAGLGGRRRRRLSDERAGAFDPGPLEPAGESADREQPVPGHGPPVAGAVLRPRL